MISRLFFLQTLLLSLLCVAAYPACAETVEGKASYYADSLQGHQTANGDYYDKAAMTAAHRTLPFGTRVTVTYLRNGKSVEVIINDRGPYVDGRIIDLSGAAAAALGLQESGIGEVRLQY